MAPVHVALRHWIADVLKILNPTDEKNSTSSEVSEVPKAERKEAIAGSL